MAKIVVLGAGMMGSAWCVPMADRGHEVHLVGTELDREIIDALQRTGGKHPGLVGRLPEGVTCHQREAFEEVLQGAELLGLGVSSAGVEWAAEVTAPVVWPGLLVASITKGLVWDGERFHLLPDVLASRWPEAAREGIAPGAVVGPCIAGELSRRVATCVAVACRDREAGRRVAELTRADYYHVRSSVDLAGLEACAAMKNAYALAVGFGRGLNEREGFEAGSVAAHNHEAAVFAQATLEMGRIVGLLGGDPRVAAGMPGAGDLFVTCQGGRTSRLGRWLGLGLTLEEAVEKMAGATLESLDILGVWASALPVLEARGEVGAEELPLLRHLIDVATAGAAVDVPFDRFFLELEG